MRAAARPPLWREVTEDDAAEEVEEKIEVVSPRASPIPHCATSSLPLTPGCGAGAHTERGYRDLSMLQAFEQLLSSRAAEETPADVDVLHSHLLDHPELGLDESFDSDALSARPTELDSLSQASAAS